MSSSPAHPVLSAAVLALLAACSGGPAERALKAFEAKDYGKAMELAKPLAEKGDKAAQNLVAKLFDKGLGVEKDRDAANAWFRKSAEAGHAESQMYVGVRLFKGQGRSEAERNEGAEWIRKAADLGFADALLALAEFHELGNEPFKKDPALVEGFVRKAAETGDAASQYKLHLRLKEGRHEVRYAGEQEDWLRRAAENGYLKAQLDMAEAGRDRKEKMRWYRKAALQGNAEAKYHLGDLIADTGVPDPATLKAARKWLTEAAESGDGNAPARLGILLLRIPVNLHRSLPPEPGTAAPATPDDAQEAFHWLGKSGLYDARLALGEMHELGIVVPKSESEAFRLYKEAADMDAVARYRVARMYEEGRGTAKSAYEAFVWYRLAAARDEYGFAGVGSTADEKSRALEASLTPKQLKDARKFIEAKSLEPFLSDD